MMAPSCLTRQSWKDKWNNMQSSNYKKIQLENCIMKFIHLHIIILHKFWSCETSLNFRWAKFYSFCPSELLERVFWSNKQSSIIYKMSHIYQGIMIYLGSQKQTYKSCKWSSSTILVHKTIIQIHLPPFFR